MPEKTLSVVIPVRNQPGSLKRLLDNLKTQKIPPDWTVEVIAVDNASTDHTAEIIRQSGFRYVLCEKLGSSAARNAGAKAASGMIYYFVDADACPVHDDHFIRLLTAARRIGQFGAFGGPILLPRHQRWNPIAIGDHWACWFNWHPKRKPQKTSLFNPSLSIVVPRAVFDAVGGFDEDVMIFHDMELQHRILRRGFPIFFAPILVVTHEARGSPLRSWRHSWSWGGPFRTRYLTDIKEYGLKYPLGDKRFARNLPMLFRRRMKLVTRRAWANSKWQTIYGYPFIAATVFAWALGVIWGRDRRPEKSQFPI